MGQGRPASRSACEREGPAFAWGVDERGEVVCRLWWREHVALRELALESGEQMQLLVGLQALGGDDREAQRLGHADDGFDEVLVAGVAVEPADERSIDLEFVDGKLA